jgi:hypothetical protein
LYDDEDGIVSRVAAIHAESDWELTSLKDIPPHTRYVDILDCDSKWETSNDRIKALQSREVMLQIAQGLGGNAERRLTAGLATWTHLAEEMPASCMPLSTLERLRCERTDLLAWCKAAA